MNDIFEKPRGFLPRIEALRGVAALTVVGFHVSNQFYSASSTGGADRFAFWLLTALFNGFGAVVVFFILSGFVLARSLDANQDPVKFFVHRLFRLFPAAVATVGLLTFLHSQFEFYLDPASFDFANVILNMLMIKNDINRVMWSMTVECFATPLIFLSVLLVRKDHEPFLWGLTTALFCLSPIGSYTYLLGGHTSLGPLYAFVVGVLIHFRGATMASLIGARLRTASFISIALFCFCGTRTQSSIVVLLECICAATLITLIAYRPEARLFNPLEFKISRFYGKISYSFYLLHLLGISLATQTCKFLDFPVSEIPTSAATALLCILSIALTTPAAYFSWRFIELPAINIARNMRLRLRASEVT